MSVTVQQIYDRVCDVMLEPGGFQLGIVTEQQFLDLFAVVILDLEQRAPLDKKIFTEMISAGYTEYVVPEDIMVPELCFVAGRLIEKVTEAELASMQFEWRRQWGPPKQWHEDNLDVKRVQIFPRPERNGDNMPGDAPPIGAYDDFFPAMNNLSIVGPGGPSKVTWQLTDTIDGMPDTFAYYLVYGILARIFSSESEARDDQRAAYCQSRYGEAALIAEVLAREELSEEDDEDN